MVNSIPKSGTHLLLRLLELLGYKIHPFWLGADLVEGRFSGLKKWRRASSNDRLIIGCEFPTELDRHWLKKRISSFPDGQTFGAHCNYSSKMASFLAGQGVRNVCIIRDPRAVAVSHMHYLKSYSRHFFHAAYMRLPSDSERLMLSIRGGELGAHRLESIITRYRQFLGWKADENSAVIRFEDLIGEQGGGCADAQRAAVERVCVHLRLDCTQEIMAHVRRHIFGGGGVFRKGRVDAWKDDFSEEHHDAMNAIAADLLKELAYC